MIVLKNKKRFKKYMIVLNFVIITVTVSYTPPLALMYLTCCFEAGMQR